MPSDDIKVKAEANDNVTTLTMQDLREQYDQCAVN